MSAITTTTTLRVYPLCNLVQYILSFFIGESLPFDEGKVRRNS